MSMDFSFWKYKEGAVRDNKRVYESACCDGNIMEELENLPIEEIMNKITSVFSDWTALTETLYENEKEDKGAFDIFTTSQIVRFACYGMWESDINALIDIFIDFGCPLYDPQIETRFDEWTDR